jgi:DNA-binding transcriptional LysR family regulator
VRLFDRTARFPVLTDQGRALLTSAHAVTGQMDLLKARAKSLAGGCEPELTVVVDTIFPIAIFTGAIAALQAQFPETALKLYVKDSGASVQHVLDRRCAIGVVVSHISTPPLLARERLMAVEIAMVVSPKHPLAAYDRPIPTAALNKYIQLMHTNRVDLLPDREFDLLSPKTWLLDHIEAKLAFLRAGFGFGALPLHVVDRDLASGALVQISTEGTCLRPRHRNIRVIQDRQPAGAGDALADRAPHARRWTTTRQECGSLALCRQAQVIARPVAGLAQATPLAMRPAK